ncbi:MAG: hypothetical protein F6K10_11970 [Moorea sp. SIO2B7]|nr:hypothetical protein [Moorena sp. SIO2B7]
MNTPSHYILNLAILGTTISPKEKVAITIGAILPDIPIFILYFVAKFVYKLPEAQIWSETYYEPFWQNLVAFFHSFPLALIGLSVCLYCGWKPGAIACASIILHSVFDFPFHHDDAHRHFFPFSDYRFISPLSYWDKKHYGQFVAFGELLLVLCLTPLVFKLNPSMLTKGLVIAINLLYVFGYVRFYLL